jgi:hypothetical protein
MMKKTTQVMTGLLLLAVFNLPFSAVFGQGTAFTYQGRLNNNGSPANGLYDFRFKLYFDPLGNTQTGSSYLTNAIPANNGLFTVAIDFGPGIFAGSNYWLEVDVRTNNAADYSVLTPLQAVTPTPEAIFAESANGLAIPLSATNISGTIPFAHLPAVLVTNNESSVTLSNVTVVGSLILANSAIYGSSSSAPLFITDSNLDVFAGQGAGNLTTTSFGGKGNEAVGSDALSSIKSGSYNAANGYQALFFNQTGSGNLASGAYALNEITNGSYNVAEGYGALGSFIEGSNNVVIGANALGFTFYDSEVVAVGYQALEYDEGEGLGSASGLGENTAVGYQALQWGGACYGNTALGYEAMETNLLGRYNTALGDYAMFKNYSGSGNTAVGVSALPVNQSGSDNVAIGAASLDELAGGSGNIAIGSAAGDSYRANESGNILVGNAGNTGESGVIRIGTPGTQTTTVIAGIYGGMLSGNVAAPVIIDSTGRLAAAPTNSFTPTIGDGTHNFITSTHTGYYTQIGSTLYFEMSLQWMGKGSAVSSDGIQISLPVPVTSSGVAFPVGFVSGVSFGNQLSAGANNGALSLFLYSLSNTGGAPSNVTVGNCATSGELQISGWYRWE